MNIDKLKELEAKATRGPWVPIHRCSTVDDTDVSAGESGGLGWELSGPPEPQLRGHYANGADVHLIATLRNLAPHLIALWEAAAKMRDSGNLEQAYGTDRPVLAALTALENA